MAFGDDSTYEGVYGSYGDTAPVIPGDYGGSAGGYGIDAAAAAAGGGLATPQQAAAIAGGIDVTGLLSGVAGVASAALPILGQAFRVQYAQKSQDAMLKSLMQGPAGMGYSRLGMGIASTPLTGTQTGGAPLAYTLGGAGVGAALGGILGPEGAALGGLAGGALGNYFGSSSPSSGPAMGGGGAMMPMQGGSAFTQSQNPAVRASRFIWQTNPVNGMPHVWVHVGSLNKILRAGMRALGLARGRTRRRRRRSYRSF